MTIEDFIKEALKEDIGTGDVTSLSCIPPEKKDTARLLVKEHCVLAGVGIAVTIFRIVDKNLSMEIFKKDGDEVNKGDIAFHVSGSTISLLSAERLVLNFMQRMSGIATHTREYVNAVRGTRAVILDTRKTSPNLRYFEKLAVSLGGGSNHRFGLFDMILIKDNHVDAAGGIEKAVTAAKQYIEKSGTALKIEVEARNMKEVREILDTARVDRIMLDNFSPEMMKQAVLLIGGRAETEASGGITLANIRHYAETGVDFISVGALTHHIRSIDLSMKII